MAMTCKQLMEKRDRVLAMLPDYLPDGITARASNMAKSNDITYYGIVLSKEGGNIDPCVYINRYPWQWSEGDICKDIVSASKELLNTNNDDYQAAINLAAQVPDYKMAKGDIYPRVRSISKNTEYTKNFVKFKYLDLYEYFVIQAIAPNGPIMSLPIETWLLEKWGISADELKTQAEANLKSYSVICQSMAAHMRWIMAQKGFDVNEFPGFELPEDMGMYVLTTPEQLNGSMFLLDPDVIRKVAAEKELDNCFIIPSSINELLLISTQITSDKDCIRDMIHMVNGDASAIAAQEVLSDSLYYYDSATGKISIA